MEQNSQRMLANLWKVPAGWLLELSSGTMEFGYTVHSRHVYLKKREAKQAAREANALPWNYA